MPLRIAYIATSAGNWGGASRYLYTTLKLLDRTRVEPLLLFPSTGPLLPELDAMGIAWEVWGEHEFHRNPLQWSRAVWRTAALLRRHRIQLLHVNHVGYWRPAEIMAARLLRIPVITHLHRVLTRPQPFVKYSTMTIANSAYTARASLPIGMPREVVYCSVMPASTVPEAGLYGDRRGQLRAELGIASDAVVISFVGQVRELKGITLFLETARALVTDGVHFLIAGECRDPEKYPGAYTEQRLRDEMGGQRNIHYLGYRGDIEQIYAESDLLLVPSQWDEPFGLINIEAGAAGLPVVATRVGGIPEAIEHGRTGFLVDRQDRGAMIRHTRELIGNAELRADMGQAARERVDRHFTTAPVRQLEGIYRRLVSGSLPTGM